MKSVRKGAFRSVRGVIIIMSHRKQRHYCNEIRDIFPNHFNGKKVLEVGSLDINGNNNRLFENCELLRIDLGPGKNVDLVCHGADLDHPDNSYETILSTEAFEHDSRLEETLKNIIRLLSNGGLFIFTCAGIGRKEHGTSAYHSFASPYTLDFYKNRSEDEIRRIIDIDETFETYEFQFNATSSDHYFWGIKK